MSLSSNPRTRIEALGRRRAFPVAMGLHRIANGPWLNTGLASEGGQALFERSFGMIAQMVWTHWSRRESLRTSLPRNRSGAFGGLVPLFLLAIAACAAGPRAHVRRAVASRDVVAALDRYEQYRTREGVDETLLREIASLVLEIEATGSDPVARDSALSQLALAGTAGRPILESLSKAGRPQALQAKALRLLAERGDRGARAVLRGFLDARDAEVLAAAVTTLDGRDDEARLLVLLEHPAEPVRVAAVDALAGATPSRDAFLALSEAARVDPVPRVRAKALRSLSAFGTRAHDVIRERLADVEPRVRTAAVQALVRADRNRALEVLGRLLSIAPSKAGVEAARVLAQPRPVDGTDAATVDLLARTFLFQALRAGNARLRVQAAVALSSLPWDATMTRGLVDRMRHDVDEHVRLSLALLLNESAETRGAAQSELRTLARGNAMPAVQAAAALAEQGELGAVARLEALLSDEHAPVRRVAARALARRARKPDAVRRALRDRDAQVRIHAAGGILAALASR